MRRLLFWVHLILGTGAGLVILIMSVSGVLLTCERQMLEWADREYRSVPSGARMSPENLIRAVQDATGAMPDSLVLREAADAPAEFTFGPRVTYADAYNGQILGDGSPGLRRFFRTVTEWHRWLGLEGAGRLAGRAITGASNLAFLLLAVTGVYLWLPRRWGWKQVRAVLLFRIGASGKARDFNWHNVIGIWSAFPLLMVIVGGVVISYPWATGLVYLAAGELPPQAPASRGSRGGSEGRRNAPGPPSDGKPLFDGLNLAWQQAEARVPGWQSITWRVDGGPNVSLGVAESHRGRVDLRSTLVVDRATGIVKEHETFSTLSRGRQWRSWLRFIHTGEALGVAGQTLAGLVSAGAGALVWTGISLSWRRLGAWKSRRQMGAASKLTDAGVKS